MRRIASAEIPQFMKALPPIEGDFFCIEVLRSMGYGVAGYASAEPLPWSEINAYQLATGIKLDTFEAETVRVLSEVWADQVSKSRDWNCEPPYKPQLTVDQQKEHAKWLRKKLRG